MLQNICNSMSVKDSNMMTTMNTMFLQIIPTPMDAAIKFVDLCVYV